MTQTSSPLTHLSSDQLQQGAVDRQQVDVGADGRLVEGAGLAVQFVKAGLTHRVGAAQADGLVAAAVKLIVADGTGQELRPLGRLHWHPDTTPRREVRRAQGECMSANRDNSSGSPVSRMAVETGNVGG